MSKHALSPYDAPEALDAQVEHLSASGECTLVEFGRSVEGRPLRACVVQHPRADAPKVLCVANIHGVEFIGVKVALACARALVDASDATARHLRERAEVWIVPSLNPDAYARTWEHAGRGLLRELRTNARGVDLNRNFPVPGREAARSVPFTASAKPGTATYRGTEPLSEPEAASIHQLMQRHRFHSSVGLHSFMGVLIPPFVPRERPFRAYRELCSAFASAQPHVRYRRLAHRHWDRHVGELEDHQFYAHDCWSLTVETFSLAASLRQHLRAPSVFWRFNPRDPEPWIRNDVSGIFAYFLATLDLPSPAALAT